MLLKDLTGAFVPGLLIVTPFGRKGKQFGAPSRRIWGTCRGMDRAHFAALDRIDEDAIPRKQAFQGWVKQRSGTISESVRLVRGADGGTITMRVEYLAAIALAAFAAGAGLAVHSVDSLPPEKQSTPAAAQLATRLAESVDPFLLRSSG